jgi:hypothetical protein
MEVVTNEQLHPLYNNWILWAHLPHDTKWDLTSYVEILTISTLEQAIAILENLPEIMIKNCMLFIMRKGIQPIWEDEKNKDGGCFSYKIPNKSIGDIWKKLSYSIVAENLINNENIQLLINGITVSPKKNFCIIKIWLKDCSITNADLFNKLCNINLTSIFKRHVLES